MSGRYLLMTRSPVALRKYRDLLSITAKSGLRDFIFDSIDPLSREILNNVNILCLFPAYLLSYFCLRFSELNFVSLRLLLSGETIKVYQPKTGQYKVISNNPFYSYLNYDVIDPTTPVMVVSYTQVKDSVHKAAALSGVQIPGEAQDATHIFRHLRASYAKQNGQSLKEIRKLLGHSGREAIKHYIHKYELLKIN
jgi:integrase